MQVSSGNEKDVYMAERLEEGATSSSCRLIAPGAAGSRRPPANSGPNSITRGALASAELYKVRAGLEAVAVPYRTSMASLSEMFSGELDFQFIDATQGTPLKIEATGEDAETAVEQLAQLFNEKFGED